MPGHDDRVCFLFYIDRKIMTDMAEHPKYQIFTTKEILPLFLLAAALIITIATYPNLPDKIPIHYNGQGQVNGWADKSTALSIPLAVMIGVYLLGTFYPMIPVKTTETELKTIAPFAYGIKLLIMAFVLVIQTKQIYASVPIIFFIIVPFLTIITGLIISVFKSARKIFALSVSSFKKALFLWLITIASFLAAIPLFMQLKLNLIDELYEIIPKGWFITLYLFISACIMAVIIIKANSLSAKAGFRTPLIDRWLEKKMITHPVRPALLVTIALSFITAVFTIGLDKFLFMPWLPDILTKGAPLIIWADIASAFYGGIVEEILMRFFMMSLMAVFIMRLNRQEQINGRIAWLAIILSSLAFSLGHLPMLIQLQAFTIMTAVRTIVLNMIGGILFGWLYWKKGLEYSMIGHLFANLAGTLIHFVI